MLALTQVICGPMGGFMAVNMMAVDMIMRRLSIDDPDGKLYLMIDRTCRHMIRYWNDKAERERKAKSGK